MANSLTNKERQMDLFLALDQARDSVEIHDDPDAMLNAIVHLLRSRFAADAAGLVLIPPGVHWNGTLHAAENVETVVQVGTDAPDTVAICQQVMARERPVVLDNVGRWHQVIGVRVVQDERQRVLGGLFLARRDAPFEDSALDLLRVAESQIDSAILQARMMWELALRNKEMEAIYRIDRLRDSSTDEAELINGFTAILMDYFGVQLCMILLSHMDSGDMILRGFVDKNNLSDETLKAVRDLTEPITTPQVIETPPAFIPLSLLAAPFIVSGVKLGTVVVGRKSDFTAADRRLMAAMISQMDTAMAFSRVIQQLYQRNHELETIYRIDQIRDSEQDFDAMLQMVLAELCRAVSSEVGYLMLYKDNSEDQLELKATTTDASLDSSAYREAIRQCSREALDTGEPVYSNTLAGPVRSIVAVPLILNERVIGVFGTINSGKRSGFSVEDRRMLTAITSQVDTAVFERLEQRRMRRLLSRSVDPKVLGQMMLQADDALLTGERVVLTVLFADLRGSTEWAERIQPEQLVSSLNAYLGRMTNVIFDYGGTLDKFVGDEVIALFGSPVSLPDHALRASACALRMQAEHHALQRELAALGIELPPMGIGIGTGEVIAGEFGPSIRTDFTAMGRTVNLGARLCSVAQAGQVLISSGTYETLKTQIAAQIGDAPPPDVVPVRVRDVTVQPLDPVALKGLGSVEVFELLALKD
jgi:adenylate cyclase